MGDVMLSNVLFMSPVIKAAKYCSRYIRFPGIVWNMQVQVAPGFSAVKTLDHRRLSDVL
jgi:hypothetical protein